jgi:branched-chain amino acid transport system ATP-binding protein
VEHALEVVEELCDRVIVMAAGRVLVEGSFDEVIADEGVRDAYLS